MRVKDKRDESVSVCKRVMERERMGEWENANGRKLTRAEVIVVVLALRVAAVAVAGDVVAVVVANFVFASYDEQKPKTLQPKFSCLPRFAHAQEIDDASEKGHLSTTKLPKIFPIGFCAMTLF